MKRSTLLVVALSIASLAVISGLTFGQDSADAGRQLGKYHLATGKTYNIHANDHARLLKKLAASGQKVPPEVLKEHVAAIKSNVQSARASFGKLRTAAQGNGSIAKQTVEIEKRLDKVSALVKQLEAQKNAEARFLVQQTAAISNELAANQAAAQDIDNNFYNMDSASYYTTGEGHFVD